MLLAQYDYAKFCHNSLKIAKIKVIIDGQMLSCHVAMLSLTTLAIMLCHCNLSSEALMSSFELTLSFHISMMFSCSSAICLFHPHQIPKTLSSQCRC